MQFWGSDIWRWRYSAEYYNTVSEPKTWPFDTPTLWWNMYLAQGQVTICYKLVMLRVAGVPYSKGSHKNEEVGSRSSGWPCRASQRGVRRAWVTRQGIRRNHQRLHRNQPLGNTQQLRLYSTLAYRYTCYFTESLPIHVIIWCISIALCNKLKFCIHIFELQSLQSAF